MLCYYTYIPGPLAQSPGTTMLSLIALEILYPKILWPTHPKGCKEIGLTTRWCHMKKTKAINSRLYVGSKTLSYLKCLNTHISACDQSKLSSGNRQCLSFCLRLCLRQMHVDMANLCFKLKIGCVQRFCWFNQIMILCQRMFQVTFCGFQTRVNSIHLCDEGSTDDFSP